MKIVESIDRLPVSYCQDKNNQFVVFDFANETEVPDTVTPLTASVGGQAFAV